MASLSFGSTSLKTGYQWRRLFSTTLLAVVVGSMALGLAAYPRLANAVRGIDPDLFAFGSIIATNLLGVAFSLSGYVILRRTSNRVGWLLQATGLLFGLVWIGLAFNALHVVGRDIGTAGRLVAIWLGFSWYPALMLMGVLLPLLFPTGRPPSRRWIWVEAVAATGLVYGFAIVTFETLTGPLEDVLDLQSRSWFALTLLAVVGVIGSGISVIVRYRRADHVERLQIKWVATALILMCLMIAVGFSPLVTTFAPQLAFAVFGLVPVSIVFAITKHHLYDIERIISRSLSYAIVIGALVAVYTAALALLTRIVPMQSDMAVAASTLGAAALFNPIRRSISRGVDRRFNRTRYVSQQELDTFIDKLKDTVELPALETDLIGVVRRTLQPSGIALWTRSWSSPPERTRSELRQA
jgi:hypothetical protein